MDFTGTVYFALLRGEEKFVSIVVVCMELRGLNNVNRFCRMYVTTFFFFFSNPVLPQSFLEAPKKNHKRHPIHKKKGSVTATGEYILPSVYQADEEELGEIPPDVQKVLEEIDLEDEAPDENTLEVLEDIWLKAGEMGRSKCTIFVTMYNDLDSKMAPSPNSLHFSGK